MNREQFDRMKNGKGFIAALDQSGGSTPKALLNYGVTEEASIPTMKKCLSLFTKWEREL